MSFQCMSILLPLVFNVIRMDVLLTPTVYQEYCTPGSVHCESTCAIPANQLICAAVIVPGCNCIPPLVRNAAVRGPALHVLPGRG
jgi:hypothetical protein